jgi:hypothetical protein
MSAFSTELSDFLNSRPITEATQEAITTATEASAKRDALIDALWASTTPAHDPLNNN